MIFNKHTSTNFPPISLEARFTNFFEKIGDYEIGDIVQVAIKQTPMLDGGCWKAVIMGFDPKGTIVLIENTNTFYPIFAFVPKGSEILDHEVVGEFL